MVLRAELCPERQGGSTTGLNNKTTLREKLQVNILIGALGPRKSAEEHLSRWKQYNLVREVDRSAEGWDRNIV